MRSRRPRRRSAPTALAVGLGLYLGAFLADRSRIMVRGPSMLPTLWPGDVLLTVPAAHRSLRVGAVVVVRDPDDATHLVVKRVSRVSPDRVEVLGDDPARSTDSRRWGPLPRRAVRRVAIARWPDLRTPLWRAVPGPEAVPPLAGPPPG